MRVITLIICSLVMGCSLDDGGDSESVPTSGGDKQGLQAFSTTLHPILAQRCQECHGVFQKPMFAVDSLFQSYDVVLGEDLVNFSNITSSRLILKGKQSHGGCTQCGPEAESELVAAIQSWWDQTNETTKKIEDINDGVGLVTQPKPVPNTLPEGETFATLRWDLTASGFPGTKIDIQIQRFGNGAFRFRRPRLINGSQSLKIEDIRIFINDEFDPTNATYRSVSVVVGSGNKVTISADTLTAIDLNGAESDQIRLKIGTLEASAEISCSTLADFETTVIPLLQAKCIGCHANVDSPAFFTFPMGGATDEWCRNTRQRLSSELISKSVFITNPWVGTNGHINTDPEDDDDPLLEVDIGDEIDEPQILIRWMNLEINSQ